MNQISDLARISRFADIETSSRGNKITIRDFVFVDSFVKIKFSGGSGDIVIEESSYINSGVVIYSGNGVYIGKNSLIAANVTLAATNHEYKDREIPIKNQGFKESKGGIRIYSDCWVGANCVILDGSTIGRGSVVAAGTIIRGNWPEFSIVAGNPPRVISKRG